MPGPQDQHDQLDEFDAEYIAEGDLYEDVLDHDPDAARLGWLDDLLDGEEDRLAEARDEIRRSTR